MNLFKSINFKSHSGLDLTWKIDMDALDDFDWFTIKKMILEITPPFREAVGIPRGGVKLGDLLNEHATGKEEDPICIVDDVLTTGSTMSACAVMLKAKGFQSVFAISCSTPKLEKKKDLSQGK